MKPFLATPSFLISSPVDSAFPALFAYIRFYGSSGLYSSCYSDNELAHWAKRLTDLAASLEAVYIYFNNDAEAFAVKNALRLGDYLNAPLSPSLDKGGIPIF